MSPAALALVLALAASGPDDRYEAGVQARLDGRFAEAAELLGAETRSAPENADAWVQYGLALTPLERYGEAEAAFERALALAPDYDDATIGLARIAWMRGDETAARRRLEGVDTPDARSLRARLDAPAGGATPQWRADLALGRSELTAGLPAWSEASLALGRRLDERTSLGVIAEYARRFGADDVYLQARIDHTLSRGAHVYAALGGTPGASFRPERAVLAGGTVTLAGGLEASVDAAYATYRAGDVATLAPGLGWRFGDQTRIGARLIALRDENGDTRTGYSVSTEAALDPQTTLLAGYANAPETSEGVTVNVSGVTLGVRRQITDTRGVSAYLVHESRGAYDRTALVIGTSWRF